MSYASVAGVRGCAVGYCTVDCNGASWLLIDGVWFWRYLWYTPPSFFSIWYLAVFIDRLSFGTWWRSIVAANIITTLIIFGGSMRVGDVELISVSLVYSDVDVLTWVTI